MRDFVIVTENTADLPDAYIKENGLSSLVLPYQIGEIVYGAEKLLPPKEFYDAMRSGATPTTSAANPDFLRNAYLKILESGKDILHLSFSSALSSSCSNAFLLANEMSMEYPDAKIIVQDTLCASLGQGLLLHTAVEMKKAGKSIEEIADWLNKNKLRLCHYFTVDDLVYLYRGGRVTRSSAILGTIINIKPVLHVDDEGYLRPISKVRGRKKSLTYMVDRMVENLADLEKQQKIAKAQSAYESTSYTGLDREHSWVFISHGDCVEDAEYVKTQIEERLGFQNFMLNDIGSSVGAHSGPGTVALFFFGAHR